MYIDGTEESSTPNFPGFSYVGPEVLTFGQAQVGDRHFAGRIDDIQVYDVALMSDEVLCLFENPGSTLPCVPDDDDGDGVPNDDDECPNNAPGLPVDCVGRPLRDANLDCEVNGGDIAIIVSEMLGP